MCVCVIKKMSSLIFRLNIYNTASNKKIFSIPYKSQSQIDYQENIGLSQFQSNHFNVSTILEDKNFSADDDLFEDTYPSQLQKEGK